MLTPYRNHLIQTRRSEGTIRVRMTYARELHRHFPNPLTCTPQDLQRFLAAHPHWKPSTYNVAVVSLRSFYGWAHVSGHITDNPTVFLQTLHVDRARRPIALDVDAEMAIVHASPEERAIILLGMEAGLRRSEIVSLHTRARDGEWLYITGKGGRTRRMHATPSILAALDAITPEEGGYYFPGRVGGHMHPSTVWLITKRLLDVNPHAMRHRAGTTVYRNTGDLRVTQEFLGHANPNTTAIYVHIESEDMRRASTAAVLGGSPALPEAA